MKYKVTITPTANEREQLLRPVEAKGSQTWKVARDRSARNSFVR